MELLLLAAAVSCHPTVADGDASVAASGTGTGTAPGSASGAATGSASATASALDCPSGVALAARLAAARDAYGPDPHTLTLEDSLLLVDADRSPLFAQVTAFVPRVLAALRHDRIAPRPYCPVSVYVFASRARFDAFSAAHHLVPATGRDWGVFDPMHGDIAVDLSGGASHVPTVAHELAHVLMNADFGSAPLWFRECVASLYEAPSLPADGEIHGLPNRRNTELAAALAAHDPDAHLPVLFGLSDRAFRGRTDAGTDGTRYTVHFATARTACLWLDATGKLWPFYRAWRDRTVPGDDGVAAFTSVVGQSPEEADATWRRWATR